MSLWSIPYFSAHAFIFSYSNENEKELYLRFREDSIGRSSEHIIDEKYRSITKKRKIQNQRTGQKRKILAKTQKYGNGDERKPGKRQVLWVVNPLKSTHRYLLMSRTNLFINITKNV